MVGPINESLVFPIVDVWPHNGVVDPKIDLFEGEIVPKSDVFAVISEPVGSGGSVEPFFVGHVGDVFSEKDFVIIAVES